MTPKELTDRHTGIFTVIPDLSVKLPCAGRR
jgi:hypothetical protein